MSWSDGPGSRVTEFKFGSSRFPICLTIHFIRGVITFSLIETLTRSIFGTHSMWFATHRWSVAAQQNFLLRLKFCIKRYTTRCQKPCVHVVMGQHGAAAKGKRSFWSESHIYQMCLIFMAPCLLCWIGREALMKSEMLPHSYFYPLFFLLPIFGVVIASSCCLSAATTSRQIYFFSPIRPC